MSMHEIIRLRIDSKLYQLLKAVKSPAMSGIQKADCGSCLIDAVGMSLFPHDLDIGTTYLGSFQSGNAMTGRDGIH
jgi:hypothetical protein